MANIKIGALGGLGDNGKNLYIVEVNERIFVLDSGLKYPDIDMYGVDAVVPNINYLITNKDRVEGIFLTHAHEDNIGAIAYILDKLKVRVYGTHFTISIVEQILLENNLKFKDYKLFRINENKVFKFGNTEVSFFNTAHSVPESIGVVINTEDGKIVYATDFSFKVNKQKSYLVSLDKLTEIGSNKTLCLLSESVGISNDNRPINDTLLEYNFNKVLTNATSKIIIGSLSTDLLRIQKIIDLSILHQKKILFIYSQDKLIDFAIKSEYLKVPKEKLVSLNNLPLDNELVIIVCGVRYEPYQTLEKIVLNQYPKLSFINDDKIIVMAPPISGMEKYVTKSINELCKNGADVIKFDHQILKSAHASKEDQQMLYSILKPKYIIPIKGEFRHMYEQSILAKSWVEKEDSVILLDNGEFISFEDGEIGERINYEVGDIFVDGSLVGGINEAVIKDRLTLAEEGVILINVVYDQKKLALAKKTIIITKGFVSKIPFDELEQRINQVIEKNIKSKKKFSKLLFKEAVTDEITKYIFKQMKKQPVILFNTIVL